jgi:hypothetical protein
MHRHVRILHHVLAVRGDAGQLLPVRASPGPTPLSPRAVHTRAADDNARDAWHRPCNVPASYRSRVETLCGLCVLAGTRSSVASMG